MMNKRPYTLLIAALSLHQTYSLTIAQAKQNVISLASELKEKGGVFVADNDDRKKLCKAVAELEAICGPPSSFDKDDLLGDWNLLCTSNVNPLPPLPFSFLPRNPIQDELRKVVYGNVDVMQKIRNDSNFEGGAEKINRVDNVIQFRTPKNDGSVLSKLPNPLELSRAKVTLAHGANVESVMPVLRTKIALKSVILTVAGTSQYLEPDGADILGVNVPTLQDILNVGVFDTPYVDDDIRISRGPAVSGFLDEQIRVFIREKADEEVVGASDEVSGSEDVEAVVTEEDATDEEGDGSTDVVVEEDMDSTEVAVEEDADSTDVIVEVESDADSTDVVLEEDADSTDVAVEEGSEEDADSTGVVVEDEESEDDASVEEENVAGEEAAGEESIDATDGEIGADSEEKDEETSS